MYESIKPFNKDDLRDKRFLSEKRILSMFFQMRVGISLNFP